MSLSQVLKMVCDNYSKQFEKGEHVNSYVLWPDQTQLVDLHRLQQEKLVFVHTRYGDDRSIEYTYMPTGKGHEWYRQLQEGIDPETPEDLYHLVIEMTKPEFDAIMQIVANRGLRQDFATHVNDAIRLSAAAYAPEYISTLGNTGKRAVIRVVTPEEAADVFGRNKHLSKAAEQARPTTVEDGVQAADDATPVQTD